MARTRTYGSKKTSNRRMKPVTPLRLKWEQERHRIPWKQWYSTRAWRVLRALVLDEEPICSICNCAPATTVDHIEPHNGEEQLFFDRDNLTGVCRPCHNRKTVLQDGGFGGKHNSNKPLHPGCDEDGNPNDPTHHWHDD